MTNPSDPSCAIAVMAKASHPGRTKTRLVPPLSFEEAAAFNTAFLKDIAANLATAGAAALIAPYMAYGPPGTAPFFRDNLPAGVGLIETWFPNFGDCLFHAITAMLTRGYASAVVLNSDSPTLPTALLVETAEVLARPGDRAVLGPADDGGYYLLGLKQAHRHLFDDIAWSTARVAEQTRARAREVGLAVHELPAWYDVDDVASLRCLHGELFGGGSFDPALTANHAAHTAALIETLLGTGDFATRIGLAPAARLRPEASEVRTSEMRNDSALAR
jgi:rSAM/selenodomain-associated transferase 1